MIPEISGTSLAKNVSRETLERLETHYSMLQRWNPSINLVARSTMSQSWTRHFEDSAQLLSFFPAIEGHWLDLGSGGGFPGLVCAVIAHERRPKLRFTLVESDQRKAVFLRTVVRELKVEVEIVNRRIEQQDGLRADCISARALAPLEQLLALAVPHLNENGICLFLKGRQHRKEVKKARDKFHFELLTHDSLTHNEAAILELKGLYRV